MKPTSHPWDLSRVGCAIAFALAALSVVATAVMLVWLWRAVRGM
jgi:hypothetical protein